MKTFRSDLSNQEFPISEKISGSTIRPSILGLIQQDYPNFTADNYLALSELNYYRGKYISEYIAKEIGELTELEGTVVRALEKRTTLTDKIDGDEGMRLTLGQKVADKVAKFGGSWPFIFSFFFFILLWISINLWWLANRAFDPYPFILLNLLLSCLAALQAPVIMMSQNRQEQKDRERAKKDYMINLKSELEIRMLHEKIDHLMLHQQERLLEIQQLQIEMLNDVIKLVGNRSTP